MLGLEAGEFACYTLYDVGMNPGENTLADIEYGAQMHMEVHCYCDKSATVNLYQDEKLLGSYALAGLKEKIVIGGVRLRGKIRHQGGSYRRQSRDRQHRNNVGTT